MAGPGQITFGTGNCPPGMYRPAAMYDCRPMVSGNTILQEDLSRTAAHYVDDPPPPLPVGSNSSAQSSPAILPLAPGSGTETGAPGGSTMLLLIGVVALIFFMKK